MLVKDIAELMKMLPKEESRTQERIKKEGPMLKGRSNIRRKVFTR